MKELFSHRRFARFVLKTTTCYVASPLRKSSSPLTPGQVAVPGEVEVGIGLGVAMRSLQISLANLEKLWLADSVVVAVVDGGGANLDMERTGHSAYSGLDSCAMEGAPNWAVPVAVQPSSEASYFVKLLGAAPPSSAPPPVPVIDPAIELANMKATGQKQTHPH
mmetsp:Transcript_19647/g.36350  ORF Transcript_19647/g.36350 Transcript_19647/m.36350 type:complete len:164 (+) Transcript_19647:889-1380(+)